MKWTNHARLESLYHIRLVGWPTDVPMQNPSGMTVGQMKTLLGALRGGSLKFERVGMGEEDGMSTGESGEAAGVRDGGDEEDISWAIQEAGPLSPQVRIDTTQYCCSPNYQFASLEFIAECSETNRASWAITDSRPRSRNL